MRVLHFVPYYPPDRVGGVGLFASPQEAVERCVRIVDRTQPDAERAGFYAKLLEIYREAQAVLAPLDHRLHALCVAGADD